MLYSDSVIIGLPSNQLIRMKIKETETQETILFNPPQTFAFQTATLFAREISFIDSNIGMAAYDGAVIRTSDGGNNWVVTDTDVFFVGGDNLQYLVGVNTNKWLVMGTNDQLYITDNAGGNAMGIATLSNERVLSLYPNPTAGLLKITPLASNATNYSVEVTNLLGQTVYIGYPKNNQIDVSNLVAGIYLLKLEVDCEAQVAKFVKE